MTVGTISSRIVADVKCYHCGHISGQIFGRRHQPLKVGDFVPRPGYTGPEVKPGMRLRCERCQGPVFLEDATNGLPLAQRAPRKASEQRGGKRDAA
jgi:hypothetical protein